MTKYSVVTNLPQWIIIVVDNCLILLANLLGREIYSFVAPVKDDNEQASNQTS